ncbi:hypothetical protein [Longimicrobium sp.]|uniref:hypothetical protein n=1 Tax=Longimicrobium sp. TaxID=2029185 RepID=UPI003B3A49FB
MSFETLRGRIKTARPYSVIHVELRERSAIGAKGIGDRDACDALTNALGFRTLGDRWVALSPAQGYQVAYEVLWRQLAYDHEMMKPALADELAREFLAHFEPDARFFTNFTCLDQTFTVHGEHWSNAVTEATFDLGLVVVDQHRAGILWAEDQD